VQTYFAKFSIIASAHVTVVITDFDFLRYLPCCTAAWNTDAI